MCDDSQPRREFPVEPEGDLIFTVLGREVLRFVADGRVFVRGTLVDDDAEIYQAFLEWFRQTELPPERCPHCGREPEWDDEGSEGAKVVPLVRD